MTARAYHTIVIGGGIVGTAVLFALAERGVTDTLLLEKNDLTHGSTWHAAGNCTHFGHDARITRLYVEALDTYQRAEKASGQSIDFHRTGSLRLARDTAELDRYCALIPLYRDLSTPYAVLTPDEVAALHPFLTFDGIAGAAHTPGDGHVDPTGATMALAKAAQAKGAGIRRQHPVNAIASARGRWSVTANGESHHTANLVVATSFWARKMLLALGLDLPLYALEHHEVITAAHPGIAARTTELPTIRDPSIPANIRQEGHGLLIGVYEDAPRPWNPNGIPPAFGRELLPPDLDRLLPFLERAVARLPAIGETGIRTANNGPICYSPDGLPLVGPAPRHPGLWLATGFAIGIGTGGGAAQYLADWITGGAPPHDLSLIHPDRYADPIPTEQALARIRATYAAGYDAPE